jgi:hypothetical protein
MKSFAKEFLRENVGGAGRQIFLGAFGKHPGWDDHIDDIGLEKESLVAAMQLLYVEGIGGQIGAWEKLDWTSQIAFNHVFVWRRETQMLVGRMWASSDGKKRTRYPMVVCAHCVGASLSLVLDTLLAWLGELQARTTATTSADDVRGLVLQFRDALREWLSTAEEVPAVQTFDADAFFSEIGFPAESEPLVKAFWHIRESQFAARRYKARAGLAPEQFRVLASSVSTARSLQFWERVFVSQLDPSVPMLFMAPIDQYWLDAIAGEPAPREFFCLRASPRALPLVSDAASELPETFGEEAQAILDHAVGSAQSAVAGREEASWMARLFDR